MMNQDFFSVKAAKLILKPTQGLKNDIQLLEIAMLPSHCNTIMITYRWSSPALLVGPSVVRRTLTHHSHAAVFRHDTLTFSEHWPLVWEGTWHYTLLKKTKNKYNTQENQILV